MNILRKFLDWHNKRRYLANTEIGRDGVIINKAPYVSSNGNLYWNVRDILFKNPK
jgi:AMMECR1 domain-containing protein